MIDAVMFDAGSTFSNVFTMPDTSGLTPLSLPESVLCRLGSGSPAADSAENVSGGNVAALPRPSGDAVRRFESAMESAGAPIHLASIKAGLDLGSVPTRQGPVPSTTDLNAPSPLAADPIPAPVETTPVAPAAVGTDPVAVQVATTPAAVGTGPIATPVAVGTDPIAAPVAVGTDPTSAGVAMVNLAKNGDNSPYIAKKNDAFMGTDPAKTVPDMGTDPVKAVPVVGTDPIAAPVKTVGTGPVPAHVVDVGTDPAKAVPVVGTDPVVAPVATPVKDMGTGPVVVEAGKPVVPGVAVEMGTDPVRTRPVVGTDPVASVVQPPVADKVVEMGTGPVKTVGTDPVVAVKDMGTGPVVREAMPEKVEVREAPVVESGVAKNLEVAKKPEEDGEVVDTVRAQPLQAAPVVVAADATGAVQIDPAAVREVAAISAATARTEAVVEAVNAIVEAVVEQIVVTPSLTRGEGEVKITLKADVLDGSDIALSSRNGTLAVSVTPATAAAAQAVSAAVPRLEVALAEHVAAFRHVAVEILPKKGKVNETV